MANARASFPGSARVSRVGFGVSPKQSSRKVREPGTASPARETRALPRKDPRIGASRSGGLQPADPTPTAVCKPPLLGPPKTKMPDGLGPSGMSHVLQQRLNCALPFQSSSSLDFFRFRGLNGVARGFLHAL
jgi:hypothetical protein